MAINRRFLSLVAATALALLPGCGETSKQGQASGERVYAVEYVIQAEKSWRNNGDRAEALRLYDQAIKSAEAEGNPAQAKTYASWRAAIERAAAAK